jgi:hypothetical protein
MADKPADFLMGVVDFFAVLLPGAVAAFFSIGAALGYVRAHHEVFGPVPDNIWADARGWVAFALASYMLGQIIYLLGSFLDWVYDLVRKFFLAHWVKDKEGKGEKVEQKGIVGWLKRGWVYDRLRQIFKIIWMDGEGYKKTATVEWFRKKWVSHDRLYERARSIKERAVRDTEAERVVNTFQWAKANVQLHSPGAAGEIHRLEADQKFFRGLIVVLIFICVLLRGVYKFRVIELTPYVALVLLSFWKYVDQRRKSLNLAYTYLIVLHSPQPSTPREPSSGQRRLKMVTAPRKH